MHVLILLRSYNIMDQMEKMQNVGAMATKEYSMLKTMEKMEAEWEGLDFKVWLQTMYMRHNT